MIIQKANISRKKLNVPEELNLCPLGPYTQLPGVPLLSVVQLIFCFSWQKPQLLYHHSNSVTLYNAGLTNDNQWMMSASNGVNTGVSRFSTLTNTMLGIYHLEKNSLDLSTSRLYTTFLCKASFLCMFFCTNDPFFFFRTTRDDMIL